MWAYFLSFCLEAAKRAFFWWAGGGRGSGALIKNLGTGPAYFTAYVVGYYVSEGSNAVYLPATPKRMGTVFIGAKKSVTVAVSGHDGSPATGTTAVDLDLTASEADAVGTLTAYADGTTQPLCVKRQLQPR